MSRLGCPQTYGAVIFRRGGDHPTYTLRGVMELSWTRKLDGISTAAVKVAKMAAGRDCCAEIGGTQPWSHELGIFRDNDIVWQGPIQSMAEDKDFVSISAADVVAWMQVRINRTDIEFVNSGKDQTDIAVYYINQAFAADDPHVREYVVSIPTGSSTQVQKKQAYTSTWFAALDELSRQDLDYTTVGRRILVGGDLSQLVPRLTLADSAFVNNVELVMDGAQLATRYCASGQQGAPLACVGDVDPHYGLVERIVTADSITEQWNAQYTAQSEYNVHYPLPQVISIPTGSSLVDTAPVGIDQLICGARIDVALTTFCHDMAQPMRLSGLSVSWDGKFENVAATLEPYHGLNRTAVLGE